MRRYHIYGKFYNWTKNKAEAIAWAKEWNGVIYLETNNKFILIENHNNAR